jgi:hypothetical protein
MHVLPLLPATLLMLSEPTPATTETITDTPPPPTEEPRFKGTGLLVSTGLVGAASLGVTIGRSVLLKKNCPLDPMSPGACTYDFGSDIGLAASAWSLNFASIGLATGAGVMLGRYHAWKDDGSGRKRNTAMIQGVGGGLVGLGAVGLATSIALVFVLPARCVDKEVSSGDPLEGDRCLLRSFPAWTMTNWASFAMIGSGSAMLAYGSAYKHRRGKVSAFRISPNAGPTYAGIGMSGRF